MTVAEWQEWEQLARTEAYGEVREDLRMGTLAQLLCARPGTPLDWTFSPDLRPPPPREESIADIARAWGAAVP